MRKGLASTIACCYPALQQMRFYSSKCIPPGTLVAYYDASRNRFVYNLVTKRRFFHKPTYDTLQLSLLALKQHIRRHNIRDISIPRLGCGYDNLHWQIVLSLLYQVFFRSESDYNYSAAPPLTGLLQSVFTLPFGPGVASCSSRIKLHLPIIIFLFL